MKLLIDECLTPELVNVANHRGFESAFVGHRGFSGRKDHNYKSAIEKGNWTFVTRDSLDFISIYESMKCHMGLVCLEFPARNKYGQKTRLENHEYFNRVLNEIEEVCPDPMNKHIRAMPDYSDPTGIKVEISEFSKLADKVKNQIPATLF